MKTIVMLLCFLLAAVPSWAAEEKKTEKTETPHYCNDMEQWAEWLALIKKYPKDNDIRTAYALRIGLCEEIKAGTIETDYAIVLFERFFGALKFTAITEKRKEILRSNKENI